LADTLFIRLSESGMATWGAFDATGRLVGRLGQGPLVHVQPALGNRRCTVLVSSIDVLTSQAELPAASQTRLRQIVPFSLEESLAEDVEEWCSRSARGCLPERRRSPQSPKSASTIG
jgi:type II secretory pathway component PulL